VILCISRIPEDDTPVPKRVVVITVMNFKIIYSVNSTTYIINQYYKLVCYKYWSHADAHKQLAYELNQLPIRYILRDVLRYTDTPIWWNWRRFWMYAYLHVLDSIHNTQNST